MAKYRKKPVVVDAVQLSWATWDELCDLASDGSRPIVGCYLDEDGNPTDEFPGGNARIGVHIKTLEGVMLAREGDWIIKGVKGELYPCKPDVFEATYEAV